MFSDDIIELSGNLLNEIPCDVVALSCDTFFIPGIVGILIL